MVGKMRGIQPANEREIVLQLGVSGGKIICEDPVDVVDRSKGKKSGFKRSWPLTEKLLAFDSSIWKPRRFRDGKQFKNSKTCRANPITISASI